MKGALFNAFVMIDTTKIMLKRAQYQEWRQSLHNQSIR
jgi:hypothetical protein